MPTVAELKADCKKLGVDGYSKLTKRELMEVVQSYQKVFVVRLKAKLVPFKGKVSAKSRAKFRKELKNLKSDAWDVIHSSWYPRQEIAASRFIRGNIVELVVRPVSSGSSYDDIVDNYGDGAADSWMEGDITWNGDTEVYLDMVSCKENV